MFLDHLGFLTFKAEWNWCQNSLLYFGWEFLIKNEIELTELGWSNNYQTDIRRNILGLYQTNFSCLNSVRELWGFGHHKNIFSRSGASI